MGYRESTGDFLRLMCHLPKKLPPGTQNGLSVRLWHEQLRLFCRNAKLTGLLFGSGMVK